MRKLFFIGLSSVLFSCGNHTAEQSKAADTVVTDVAKPADRPSSVPVDTSLRDTLERPVPEGKQTKDQKNKDNPKSSETPVSDKGKETAKADPPTKKTVYEECPKDIICTQIFKSESITLKDLQGKPVVLDAYNTYYGGSVIGTNKKMSDPKAGRYVLADDQVVGVIPGKGTKLTFKGFKDGKQVIAHIVTIGHDCCHVRWISGSKEAVVK